MSDFVRHTSCPRCGSRDNLALYRGGSGYCFGCGFVLPRTVSPYIVNDYEQSRQSESSGINLPEGTEKGSFGSEVLSWAANYNVGVQRLLECGVQGSKLRNQLIFCWYDDSGKPILAQARNFSKGSKLKYVTYGKPDTVLPIYYLRDASRRTDRLVVVEDALSSIKIASLSDSMPCLSSDVSLTKLKRMAALYGTFTIWLDSDMYHKAQRMAKRLELLGAKADVVWTELDPKYYSLEEINAKLCNQT